MTSSGILRGVDLAAFAVALVAKLRSSGVIVSASGPAVFVESLHLSPPTSRAPLYWSARLTLVNRVEDLAAFDAVFSAVFDDALVSLDPVARRVAPGRETSLAGIHGGRDRGDEEVEDVEGVPWVTRPTVTGGGSVEELDDVLTAVPDTLPSRLAAMADEPFARFDADDLRLLGSWLEQATARWPRRRARRREVHRRGRRIDLRATMNRSRATGWEPVVLARSRTRTRPRRIVMLCDVSRSMQPYAAIYLHLMRAAVQRPSAGRPEVFAFSTSLTRLTPVLSHRSAETAVERANEKVADRFGGTHIAGSLGELLASPHGNALRGALVVIASDGWDSDDPDTLAHMLVRIRRRAHSVVWLNPRAGDPGFEPLAGSMAAALPLCDAFLPAHSLSALRDALDVIGRVGSQGVRVPGR
ncbi:VWA containing CoxE family protein [Rhodococcus sp. WMMA185]|uniref:vWA domain-containing protein n=1 Tax=Rhodococcus sp. WMMA185 TaxID=679318 RepID=UPI000878143F|nr:VWA domain-containing protein [Rhodococcus sp. WMMA185]AOW91734.1 VWA containing CoxE family protein [Rhodococcus sp. WMMA185]